MKRSVIQSSICVAFALLSGFTAIGCSSTSDNQDIGTEKAATEKAATEMMVVALDGQQVEASCGQCQFGMTGDGCNLAIRHGGVAYFVNGSAIDDHGDAHAADGFCNAVRKAEVSGRVEYGKFVATAFQLVDTP